LKIAQLKQEAGEVVPMDSTHQLDFSKYPVGKVMALLPWHACAAGAMHPHIHVLDPNGRVVDVWKSCRGWG
jgi:D-serine deaminase-like pyridoxal phosphate-dependent protein